jgi:hypothetical protein
MKKIILTAIAVATVNAQAVLRVEWGADAGFNMPDATVSDVLFNGGWNQESVNDPDNPGNPSGSLLFQVIFTTVEAFTDATPGAGIPLIDQSTHSVIGFGWSNEDYGTKLTSTTSTSTFSPGWFYGRVFQPVASEDTLNVVEHMWFRNTALVTALSREPNNPQFLNFNAATSTVGFGTDDFNLQVIPEPSAVALLGLGGLMLAIRRKRMAA